MSSSIGLSALKKSNNKSRDSSPSPRAKSKSKESSKDSRKTSKKLGAERATLKHPRKDYGRRVEYVPRGTPEGIERYGATSRTATDTQMFNRGYDHWSGSGAYSSNGGNYYSAYPASINRTRFPDSYDIGSTTFFTGDGGFWSDIWDGIKGAATDVYRGVKGAADQVFHGVKDIASTAFDDVKNVADGVGRDIIGTAKKLPMDIAKGIMHGGMEAGIPLALASGATGMGSYFVPEYIMDMLYSHPEGIAVMEGAQNGSITHIRQADGANKPSMDPSGRSAMPTFDRAAAGQIAMGAKRQRGVIGSGLGDMGNKEYRLNNLINYGSPSSRTNPMIKSLDDETGDLIFSYREYIKDVKGGVNDSFQTIERVDLNPGLSDSFPLLSRFASLFEEYDFEQLIFQFKSLVTEGNSTAAGSVMLVPNYNPSSTVLGSKRAVENTDQCVSGKVTGDLFCGIECDNKKSALGGLLYTRISDVPREQRRTYDMGFVQVALQGCPVGLHIGELWVDYRVRLSKLRVNDVSSVNVGDGFEFVCIAPPATGTPNAFTSGPFGVLSGTTLSPEATSGFYGTINKLMVPLTWTDYYITSTKPSTDVCTSDFKLTFPVQSGQKYLVMYTQCGQSLALPAVSTSEVLKPAISMIPVSDQVISLPAQISNSVICINHVDPSAPTEFGQTLSLMTLIDLPAGQFVQEGTINLHQQIVWDTSELIDSHSHGISTMSVTRVPYEFILPQTSTQQ